MSCTNRYSSSRPRSINCLSKRVRALSGTVQLLREAGKTIVQSHGIWDLIHPGHICHLEEAGELGDALKVSLTSPPVEGRANEACIEFFAKLL